MILPIYLQRYILKHLCIYINKNSKNYLYKKNEIDLLKKSIALTNWTFFKSLSLNLSVLIILNQNNENQTTRIIEQSSSSSSSKYQLLKIENIQYINFIYHYKNNNFNNLSRFNQEITNFKNLKKIIIDRCDLITISKIEFNNLKIQDYYLSNNNSITIGGSSGTTTTTITNNNNIKEITNLSIAPNNSNPNLFIDFFKKGIKVKRILEIDYYSPCQIPFKQLSIANNGNNLNHVENYDLVILTIKDLYYIFKSSPKLKRLSFYICYDNLIYHLTNRRTQQCKCSNGNIGNHDGATIIADDGIDEQQINNRQHEKFKLYWNFVSDSIANHKNLTFLKIVNKCLVNNDSASNYQKELNFPSEFIQSFSEPFRKNNSIKAIMFNGFHTPEIFERILQGNKSIFHYHSEFLDLYSFQKKIQYKETIELLLSKNNHIKYFLLKDKDNNNYLLNYSIN